MPAQAVLRSAVESDLVAINDIYNHYVMHATCTYQEAPEPPATMVREARPPSSGDRV
jgi:L-amino acid N-acyltransferase YncA